MIYLKLFTAFFKVGLFTIGGGYASLPLIYNAAVEANGWLTDVQYTDLLTIAEITPGPIALNAATFVGTQAGGLFGAVASTLGVVLPSLIISLIIAWVYFKYRSLKGIQGALFGLRPAVVGMIASAALYILLPVLIESASPPFGLGGKINIAALVMFAMGFVIMKTLKPKPVYMMFGFGGAGIVYYYLLPYLIH